MTVLKPATVNLIIYQGATYWKEWTWKDGDGNPIDLTNYVARMMIREDIDAPTTLMSLVDSPVGDKYLPIGGKVEGDPTNGKYGIWLAATITEAIKTWEEGVYDYELVDSAGFVRRIMSGTVKIDKEVTHPDAS